MRGEGDTHGKGGMCGEWEHAWQGGMCGGGGAWQKGGMHDRELGGACVQERRPLKRAVRILLECIRVITNSACHSPAFRSELFSDLYG